MRMDSKHETKSSTATERERGVSDVLAFTLTFAIIITGVGLVSTVALEPITDFTDRQETVNSERGFQNAASTVDGLHLHGDTYGQFDLVPGDGDIFLARQTSGGPVVSGVGLIERPGAAATPTPNNISDDLVELNQSIDATDNFTVPTPPPPAATPPNGEALLVETNTLVNRLEDGSSVGYEAGAVFRSDAAGLSYEPAIEFRRLDSGGLEAYVSIVNLLPAKNVDVSVGGFEQNLAIGPTEIPAGTPVTAANRFSKFEVERGTVAQVSDQVNGEFGIWYNSLFGNESWQGFFEQQAQQFSEVQLEDDFTFANLQSVTCDCERATIRIVEVRLSQLE